MAAAVEEAFPIGFTKGIRSYWRSPQVTIAWTAAAAGRGTSNLVPARGAESGSGSDGGAWAVRLGGMFRTRVKAAAPAATTTAVAKVPARVLGRVRDAYVDAMVGVAKKQAAAALSQPGAGTTEALWQKRVPVRRSRGQSKKQLRQKADELGQRLVMEMYKSVLASRDLSSMLQASRAQ
ncbi:hypothetical protein OsJ_02802 [Oryza sativa Japonica Group]|uniref:Uncharacterized protein n=1 Tax=Oryza sativa subsp. japonica TaxID=39947 RepID=A2ZVY4_ORYSJ|nr:hypothetical protein OsJ_02802 [Oryza sativa Japonica Group]